MAFEDLDWASDANYPAGSESWSAAPTRVAPSAGQQAAGVAPEDVLPAQWFNWLFGNIVESGQALEARGLQEAWDRAEADGVTTPHLSVGTDDLVVGTDGVPGLFKVNGNTNQVEVDGTVAAVSGAFSSTLSVGGNTITVPITVPTGTPTLTAVVGAGATTGDIIAGKARFMRVGSTVSFGYFFSLDTSGYSTTWYGMNLAIPVASNFAAPYDVQAVAGGFTTGGAVSIEAYANAATNTIEFRFTLASVPATMDVHITGTYEVI